MMKIKSTIKNINISDNSNDYELFKLITGNLKFLIEDKTILNIEDSNLLMIIHLFVDKLEEIRFNNLDEQEFTDFNGSCSFSIKPVKNNFVFLITEDMEEVEFEINLIQLTLALRSCLRELDIDVKVHNLDLYQNAHYQQLFDQIKSKLKKLESSCKE